MKAMLDAPHDDVVPRGRVYVRGTVPAKAGGAHRVALALADQGTASAAHYATLLSEDFPEVEVIVMVGIAGAVPHPNVPEHHVRLGDIVVSGEGGVVAYDFVKEREDFAEPRHPPRPPDAAFLQASRRLIAAGLEGSSPWLAHVSRAAHLPYSDRPPPETDRVADTDDPTRWLEHPLDPDRKLGEPRIFLGQIACANTLLKNPRHRDQIRDTFGVRAVEMEGFGIAETTWSQGIGYFIVRGTCDYCDRHKGDAWQGYAAIAAAAYTRALLEETPALPASGDRPVTRQVRTTTLSEQDLKRSAAALLDAGTPPSLAALFPDASADVRRALNDLSRVPRVLKAVGTGGAEDIVEDLSQLIELSKGQNHQHLIVAPPGSGKTHALWHGAQGLKDSSSFPIYLHAGAAKSWAEIEQYIEDACDIDGKVLLRDPRVCVLLDGWSEFAEGRRAEEYMAAQRSLLNTRVVANGRQAANQDPRFRVWELQPLPPASVERAILTGLCSTLPSTTLAELLRLPLALSLYLLLDGNALTRGELLAQFHKHLSKDFPESFRQVLAGAVAAVSLSGRERLSGRLHEALRGRAETRGLAEPEKLLERLGTLDTRHRAVTPVHDLYWSWLSGLGLLAEDRVDAAVASFSARDSVILALESGASPRESTVIAVRGKDIIFATSLSRYVDSAENGAAETVRASLAEMFADNRSAVRCRAALAAIESRNEGLLRKALDVMSATIAEGIYVDEFEGALDPRVLYPQRGVVAAWLGSHGTEQLIEQIALRGDASWGTWLRDMAATGKLPPLMATAAALACEGCIPAWTSGHLAELASKESHRLRSWVAPRGKNLECARWIAEHYETCTQQSGGTFVDLNSVLAACGDDSVFERLLERYPTMPADARSLLEYGIVKRGEPWVGRFQMRAFGEAIPGDHHKLAEVVSDQIDDRTARDWIAKGRVVEGWRALIKKRGNEIVPELIAALPESFDGQHVIPVLEVMRFLKDPPDELADALWARTRGTLQPRAAEFLIYALAPIIRRGIPSLVAQWIRDPFFMTPYHFARFLRALEKWELDTGCSFRVRDGFGDIQFTEWIVWRRVATDRRDVLYKSRLLGIQSVVRALLARFDDDPALCTELITACGKAGSYHRGLVDYLLAAPERAAATPTLFADSFDTFPEEALLRVVKTPGINVHLLLRAIAAAPNASHAEVHTEVARQVLAGKFDLWQCRQVASALRVHSRSGILRILREVCTPRTAQSLWLIRETEKASGELLVDEQGDWLS